MHAHDGRSFVRLWLRRPQALYAFGSGGVTAALTPFSGFFHASYGGGAFVAMAVLCGLALPLAWFGFIDARD